MSILRGPADADHFRQKVGRYNDRWYADPLPTCDTAEATDTVWPAYSIVKGASGKDWSFVALKRVAHAEQSELERLPKLEREPCYDALKSLNTHGLNVAAGRGTIVHWWGEDLLHGREPRDVSELDLYAAKIPTAGFEEAIRYLPALRAFFDAFQPTLVATEYPVIHRDLNGVGYGATPDGLMHIDGKPYAYDFKTRSADGDHAAYPEDGAQIGAGARAQYMIVEGDTGAERRRLPPIDGGIVISIKPDGCRVYPVDLDKGFEHFTALHAWWCARRNERDAIGSPWAPRKKGTGCSTDSTSTQRANSSSATNTITSSAENGVTKPSFSSLPPSPTTSSASDLLSTSLTSHRQPESTRPSNFDSSSETSKAVDRPTLVDRTKALVDAGHGIHLSYVWPEGVPGFRTDHEHTAAELAQILDAVRQVEDEHSMPWHPADAPAVPENPASAEGNEAAVVSVTAVGPSAQGDALRTVPTSPVPIDEGDDIDDATYEALKARHHALGPDDRKRLEQLSADAAAAGLSISLRTLRSVRRWEIARALVLWCENGWDDSVIRDLLGALVDSEIPRHPATPLGAVVGTLTIDEAHRFAELAQRVSDGAALQVVDTRWAVAS